MNYIGGVVKILEAPKQCIFDDNILVVKFRAQFPQLRNSKVINLTFYSKLADDLINYYKVNDYILIEGYLSLRNKSFESLVTQNQKKINISVYRIYPFFLSYNSHSNNLSD